MLRKLPDNPRYPHTIKIVRTVLSENPFDDGTDEDVLYEGPGRSFTDTTTTGDIVDVNKRKASIPVRYDVWGAGREPLDGDTIIATVGENSEIGVVRDCEPDNDRSLVYWDFVRV